MWLAMSMDNNTKDNTGDNLTCRSEYLGARYSDKQFTCIALCNCSRNHMRLMQQGNSYFP